MIARFHARWPKGPTEWIEARTLYVSVPFTWNLPAVRARLWQRDFRWDWARVGGPAVDLMPDYLRDLPHVDVGGQIDGVLQRVNPRATRTTTGCVHICGFCGVGRGLIEPGGLQELEDWPDRPIVCDNNLLAASPQHVQRAIERLCLLGEADFNQGLDVSYLGPSEAEWLAMIPRAMIRIASDEPLGRPTGAWLEALDHLLVAGVPKSRIRSYCLIGWRSGPAEAWARCRAVEAAGVKALPMWFHELDALERNVVTREQRALGWTDIDRKAIFQWFYQHRTSGGRYRRQVPEASLVRGTPTLFPEPEI